MTTQVTLNGNPLFKPASGSFDGVAGKKFVRGSTIGGPYLVTATPLTHILEVRIETWFNPNLEMPELIMTLMLPNEINRIMRLISQAYMTTLTSIPDLMIDKLPPIAIDTFPITCMVWNVQGAGSRAFSLALKELIRIHKPVVLVLVETHMGGAQALKLLRCWGTRVTPAWMRLALAEAYGFIGKKIWLRLNLSHNNINISPWILRD